MTKTLRRGLIAVLLFVMAVLLGVASFTALGGTARAAEMTPVQQFETYMEKFDGKTLDEENLLKDSEKELWLAYKQAKLLYADMDTEVKATISQKAQTTFSAVDVVLGRAYAISARIAVDMLRVSRSKTYADNEVVTALETDIKSLSEGELKYVNWDTDNQRLLNSAKENMTKIKANIDAVSQAINEIEYYTDAGKAMIHDPAYDPKETTHRIVLGSETSIDAVKTAVEKIDPADTKFVENYANYESAVAKLAEQKKLAQDLVDLVDDLYSRVVEKELYYTLLMGEEGQKMGEMHDGLAKYDAKDASGVTNYNDLTKLAEDTVLKTEKHVTGGAITAKEAVEEMTQYMQKVEDQITATEGKIKEIDSVSAEYTDEYENAIKAAEAEFDKLDKDIKDHDSDLYEAKKADPAAPGEYIVEGYDKMRDARAQYDEWHKTVEDLIQAVKDMIAADEKHENVTQRYNDIIDVYKGTDPELTPRQKEKFETAEVDYNKAADGSKKATCQEVLDDILSMLQKVEAQVGSLNSNIHNLYGRTTGAGKCVFGERKTLLEYKETYEALTEDEKPYVTHKDELDKMLAEYETELALVKAFVEKVNALPEAGTITVENWNLVDEATAAFKALVHDKEVLAEPKLGLLQTVISIDTEYKTYYEKYTAAVKEKDTLVKAIEALDTQMAGLKVDPNLDLSQVGDWTKTVEAATDAFNKLADKKVTAEWMAKEHKAAWDNYQKALQYIDKYGVEAKIEDLYEGTAEEAESNVTLNHKTAIEEAEAAYSDYCETHSDDIRNVDKLKAARAALDKIAAELNAWRRSVVKLYKPDFSDTATGDEIVAALKEADDFPGYPLDLKAWQAVSDKYTEVIGSSDDQADRKAYVKDAKDVLDALKTKSDAAIKALEDEVTKLDESYTENGTLTPEELKRVEAAIDKYNDLHESQQKSVSKETLDKLNSISDELVATEAFQNMLDELYADVVTNKNVTSLTIYYVDVIEAIYNQFTADIKATFKDYETKIAEIKEAYEAAKAAGSILSLQGLSEATKEILENYATSKDLDDVKTKLEKAYKDAIAAAVESMQHEIDKEVKDLNGKLEDLTSALETFKTSEEAARDKGDKELADKLASAVETLNKTISALQARVGELETKAEELETNLNEEVTNRESAIQGVQQELLAAKTQIESDYKAAIQAATEALKTELGGQINDLQSKLDELEGNLENLLAAEKAAKEAGVEGGVIAQLKDQITAVQNSINDYKTRIETLEAAVAGIDGKIDAAKDEIQSNIDSVASDLSAYKQQVSEDIEQAISDLRDDLESEIHNQVEALQEKVQKLIDAEAKAVENGYDDLADELRSQITELQTKASQLESSLNDANANLQSSIDSLRQQLADAKTSNNNAQGTLNSALVELEAAMKAADADLQSQIDKLGSTATALIAVIIVLAVIVVGAAVCIVILFLRRNKK